MATVDLTNQGDLEANHAGRMSASQRRMMRGKLVGFLLFSVTLILMVPLPIIYLSYTTMLTIQKPLGSPEFWLPIVGLSLSVLLTAYLGLYTYSLFNDWRTAWLAKDCGSVALVARRMPQTLFRLALYLIVSNRDEYPIDPQISTQIKLGDSYCIYYAPRTHTVIAVEPLSQ